MGGVVPSGKCFFFFFAFCEVDKIEQTGSIYIVHHNPSYPYFVLVLQHIKRKQQQKFKLFLDALVTSPGVVPLLAGGVRAGVAG